MLTGRNLFSRRLEMRLKRKIIGMRFLSKIKLNKRTFGQSLANRLSQIKSMGKVL